MNLEIYKIYLDLNKPPINRNFLIEVRKSFDERTRSKLKSSVINLPHMDMFERYHSTSDFEDVVRSFRRSIKGVEKLYQCKKVVFPNPRSNKKPPLSELEVKYKGGSDRGGFIEGPI